MPPLPSPACALVCALVAVFLHPVQLPRLTYDEVVATGPDDLIDLVEVLEQVPEVRLAVYHDRRRQRVEWDSGARQPKVSPTALAAGEDFLVSDEGRVLGVRALVADDAETKQWPSALETRIRFDKGIEGGEVGALAALAGVRGVRASAGASTLLFTLQPREHGGPATIELFARKGSELVASGSYTTELHGRIQLSRDGRLIVQEDGSKLSLRSPQGAEVSATPAGIGFQLSGEREVLVVLEPRAVRFAPLHPESCALEEGEARLALPGPALGAAVAGSHALVFTRKTLHWLDWRQRRELWSKTLDRDQGRFASVDARVDPGGRTLLAVGRLDVRRQAGLHDGEFRWGEAGATVLLFDGEGRPIAEPHHFDTVRWRHDSPRVRILLPGRRILVQTGDRVLLSRAVP